jgi:tetratricopeptide (TPR) repeat protein
VQPVENESQDVDQRLLEMQKTIRDLRQRCHKNSAFRVANDLVRLARREGRLIPLLDGQFQVVNLAQDLFQHRRGREVSIDMIAVLESPDRARQLQADYSETEYAETCAWMTACAYDNLAKHSGEIYGYNSEGMHQCISDGIDVCRRTGKLRCIACFREYATQVYLASDDIEMAMHHASVVASLSQHDAGGERRWIGARDKGTILTLMGELPAARDSLVAALSLAETFHDPLAARLETLAYLEITLWLLGEAGSFLALTGEPLADRALPHGEDCWLDIRWDYRDAVAACCNGDFAKGIELLTSWDTRLGRDNLANEWFEARLRLIAAYRLAGKQDKIESLAEVLFKAAQKSRDFRTLRRLRRLLDSTEPPTPTAMLAAPRAGPFAPAGVTVPAGVPVAASEAPPTAVPQEPPPMHGILQQTVRRLQSSQDDNARTEILNDILKIPPGSFTDPRDAASFLHLLPYLFNKVSPWEQVWAWAQEVAAPFPQTSYVVNLLAAVGDILCRWPDSGMDAQVDVKRLDSLFRKSLDLDPDNAPNHGRAGSFYLAQGNLGEAERCVARGFRLERNDSNLALRLAAIYQRTARPRDALGVLDLCLREGCQDASVAWQAAITAQELGQYEFSLTYLNRFESLQPGQPWVGYYRAIALLEQGEPEKALESLSLEESRGPQRPFGIAVLRACAFSALGETERFRELLNVVIGFQWSEIDYFTREGLSNLAARLWKASGCLPPGEEQVARLALRLILTGLAPATLFEPLRQQAETTGPVNYYRCTLSQPLNARWADSAGCLHGQAGWTAYRCLWGVLARDEAEAGRLALAQQAKCYDLEATVEQIEDLNQSYTDKPGVVWQGMRWNDADAAGAA